MSSRIGLMVARITQLAQPVNHARRRRVSSRDNVLNCWPVRGALMTSPIFLAAAWKSGSANVSASALRIAATRSVKPGGHDKGPAKGLSGHRRLH